MSKNIDKYNRPDYDYYEDSLGDEYGDYDELGASSDSTVSPSYRRGKHRKDDIEKEDEPYPDSEKDADMDVALKEPEEPEETNTGSDTPRKYKYSREYLIGLMDKYHNGNEEDRKDVRYRFCLMLTPLIKKMVRTSRGVDSENGDYIQHCYLYVCKRLDRFDPNISFAFEYFKYVIREAITACHENAQGKTSHETNIDRKVRKKMREYAPTGLSPTPSRIAAETGLSVRQTEDSITRIRAEKPVLGDDMSVFDRDDGSNRPLESVLKNEVTETLENAISFLPEKERTVILLAYNNIDENLSNKQIAKIMHVSEIKVTELLISAKRHLKRDFALEQLLGKSTRMSRREVREFGYDPIKDSFDPESTDYQLIDEDEEPVEHPGKREYLIVDRISDITFESY